VSRSFSGGVTSFMPAAAIRWCDETGAGADERPACGDAPEGEPVTIEVPGPTSA
jgi:hypothetical protein